MSETGSTVILDTGSTSTRAGMITDEMPTTIIPTVVERPKPIKHEYAQIPMIKKYPIEHGWVTSWDDYVCKSSITIKSYVYVLTSEL